MEIEKEEKVGINVRVGINWSRAKNSNGAGGGGVSHPAKFANNRRVSGTRGRRVTRVCGTVRLHYPRHKTP